MLQSTQRSLKDNNENFQRQGSLRKVLPSTHDKEALFGRQNEDLNDFYKICRQEYIILSEYKMLQSENLQGIYVIPSKESSLTWFGVIFVRSGLYEDGVFRFNLILPDSFPDCGHPKVVFQSDIYHPVICEHTNEVNLNRGFPVWNKGEQHVWQILKYVHWIFYNLNNSIAHAVNETAVNLFKNNQDAFNDKVGICVKLSQHRLFDNPPTDDKHYIVFEKYSSEKHDSIRASVLARKEARPLKEGHSWVSPGAFKPLTRPQTPPSESDS